MPKQEKYFVYFYYDSKDTLLYIGKAVDVGARWNGHNDPWKHEVCKIGVITCPDRAAMDVLESYFITKMPTKYNKAGLQHGYTAFEISNEPIPVVYSLDEFKKKFLKKATGKSSEPKLPVEERLRAAGFEILELGPRVNLFDEALLQKDLDRVCFRYRNFYLVSRYSHHLGIPGYYVKKSEAQLSHRTNNVIQNVKSILCNPRLEITDLETGQVKYWLEISEKDYPSAESFFNAGLLYDFYGVSLYRSSESFRSLRHFLCQLFSEVKLMQCKDDGKYFLSLIKEPPAPARAFHPILEKNLYCYDFEKMISVVKERRDEKYLYDE